MASGRHVWFLSNLDPKELPGEASKLYLVNLTFYTYNVIRSVTLLPMCILFTAAWLSLATADIMDVMLPHYNHAAG
jgi:hypothetical protein